MHNLLYYPDFEIQDQNFLKFALLYIDEIRTIIPDAARDSLSESMQNILRHTNLINPYAPDMDDRMLASEAAVDYLEKNERNRQYSRIEPWREIRPRNYTLYSDKFTNLFEDYCLHNNLGEECNEGILLNKDIAYVYMSILAGIISKETETDIITNNIQFTDPTLRYVMRHNNRRNMERLNAIRNEIQFHVPVDMRNIPLDKFIELRSDSKFENARENYVRELNKVLDSYDSETDVDLRDLIECKKEIYRLLTKLFFGCTSAIVIASSLLKIHQTANDNLNFWNNVKNIAVNAGTLRNCVYAAGEFARKVEGKRQARKYLAWLRCLR